MGWSIEQQNRLNKELEIVQKYFSGFQFVNSGGELCLDGRIKTNSGNRYSLRLIVPRDIPNSVPNVIITSPIPVTDFSGRNLTIYENSASMHLLSPINGYPRICTYKATYWNPNRTFYNVLMKARIWLEALDGHKSTGQPLDYYLKHQT